MSRTNFRIYVDRGGKMPQLRDGKWEAKSHPYYVEYRGNKPVAYHGPLDVVGTNGKLYDYDKQEYVDASGISQV